MANTAFGVNDPLAVKLWSKKLMYESLKETWISKFIGKGSDSLIQIMPETGKQAGDQVTFGLRVLLTGDGVTGDATLEGNEEALSFYSDSAVINQLRHAVRSAGKMSEQRVPYSIREEARQGLSDWLAERYDISFFNQITGNTNATTTQYIGLNTVTAPDAAHAIFPGDAGSEASCTTSGSSAFVLTLIDKAKLTAKLNSPMIRPLRVGGEDKYVMFIHPYAHYQLRTQSSTGQYMDIQKAAMMGGQISKNPIYTGAIGEYGGVILHEAVRIPWGTSATNTFSPQNYLATASVARNVLCGAQSAVMAFGQNTSTGLQASWKEELFDYGNQLGVAAGVTYGLKKTIFNSKDFGTVTVSTYSPAP